MKSLAWLSLTIAVSLGRASTVDGQIISTALPIEPSSAVSQGISTSAAKLNAHMMAGLASWDFDYDLNDLTPDTTSTGGRNGLLVAADVAVRMRGKLSTGVGGWFNSIGENVLAQPLFGIQRVYDRTAYAIYANLFWGGVGVEAGLVPFNNHITYTRDIRNIDIRNDHTFVQYDADVFGLYRLGSPGVRHPRWSGMVGAGIYQFGSRDFYEGTVVLQIEAPKEYAFSGFVTGSATITRRLSIDGSFWYTEHTESNLRQIRLTIGLGVGL
jgi:hypothetical protein